MSRRDDEIRDVIAGIDGLLGALNASVDVLSAILGAPGEQAGEPGNDAEVPG